MDYSHFAVLLLLVGVAMLFAEVFIPSGGILALVASIAVVASLWCAHGAWWDTNPNYFWTFLGVVIVALPVGVATALYVFPRTPFGRRILLEGPDPTELTAYADEEQHLRQLVGKTGKTLTLLSPGGLVQVGDERIHCESEGMLIEPGTDVEVVGCRSNRLVVRILAARPEERLLADEEDEEGAPDADRPLDFDISQG